MKIKLVVTVETDEDRFDKNEVAKAFAELFHVAGDLYCSVDGKEVVGQATDGTVIEIDGFGLPED